MGDKRDSWIFIVAGNVLFLSIIFLPSKTLLRNAVIGVISGIISYLVSQGQITKIVRDDSTWISNRSFPGFLVLLVDGTASGFLVDGLGEAILSFGLTLLVGFLISGLATITHPPTHNLTTRQ